MKPTNHRLIQIFRTGTFVAQSGRSFTFSEHDLSRAASVFDPARHAAPLCLGHPDNDEPSYGKVLGLIFNGDSLYAQVAPCDELISLVKGRRYSYVSASFHSPFSEHNPVPGAYYLKHVGFLGAVPPAVKGMTPPAFSGCASFSDDMSGIAVHVDFSESLGNAEHLSATYYAGCTENAHRSRLHKIALHYRKICPNFSYGEAVCFADKVFSE